MSWGHSTEDPKDQRMDLECYPCAGRSHGAVLLGRVTVKLTFRMMYLTSISKMGRPKELLLFSLCRYGLLQFPPVRRAACPLSHVPWLWVGCLPCCDQQANTEALPLQRPGSFLLSLLEPSCHAAGKTRHSHHTDSSGDRRAHGERRGLGLGGP